VDELLPVKKIMHLSFDQSPHSESHGTRESGILSRIDQKQGEFRAVAVQAVVHEGRVHVLEPHGDAVRALLGLNLNDAVAFMPYY
jgi:hypothetical protein